MADKSSNEVDELKRELETLRKDFAKLVDSVKNASGAQTHG